MLPSILLVFLVALSAFGQQYQVTDLGVLTNLPSQKRSTINAINNHGQIVGVNLTNGVYRAMLYNGDWKELGTLGGSNSAALGINDLGQMVGYAQLTGGSNHAFLWVSGSTNGVVGNPEMSDLGTLGGSESQADDINDAGQIGGYSNTASNLNDHAILYAGGNMADIHTLEGTLRNSYSFGINSSGQIAGTAYSALFSQSTAFWYDGTNIIDLGNFGWVNAVGLDINDAGAIVGYATDVDGFDHAYRYAGGVATDLGSLGGDYSYAISINKNGVIVGGSFTDIDDYHAFISAGNGLFDLNNYLDATGDGWELTEARAINDKGQIAGVGRLNGVLHGFLLEPYFNIVRQEVQGADLILEFSSVSNNTYFIQASTNLDGNHWVNMITNISGNTGTTVVTNYGAVLGPQGYFRVGCVFP